MLAAPVLQGHTDADASRLSVVRPPFVVRPRANALRLAARSTRSRRSGAGLYAAAAPQPGSALVAEGHTTRTRWPGRWPRPASQPFAEPMNFAFVRAFVARQQVGRWALGRRPATCRPALVAEEGATVRIAKGAFGQTVGSGPRRSRSQYLPLAFRRSAFGGVSRARATGRTAQHTTAR